ncbi:General transcription factor II-I repeat domain-containing protein 2A [Eumeta japonica]|uniref:General transcription factor II-I repeat domain-containing protein 2A n=1 Tax=Eumeta variegata TaxID=151549 RepID=A0A4C1X071_EUMVA|nr:General transcription factor II-I repeat domain-containing protein 2A [Eumeta japonica]
MIANDIKTTLTDRMAGFESFSIALDESTDLSDTAQLAIFIRGVDKDFTVTEELLALQPLKGTTTEEDIFNEVQKVVNDLYSHWKAFQNKILLWEAQMLSGSVKLPFHRALYVWRYCLCLYAEELKLLPEQFLNRFSDFKNMEDCFNLFATTTKSNVQNDPIYFQIELIEIQENSLLKSKFEDVELSDFYKKYLEEDYFSQLRKFTRRLLCAFGSANKCEQLLLMMKVAALGRWAAGAGAGRAGAVGNYRKCRVARFRYLRTAVTHTALYIADLVNKSSQRSEVGAKPQCPADEPHGRLSEAAVGQCARAPTNPGDRRRRINVRSRTSLRLKICEDGHAGRSPPSPTVMTHSRNTLPTLRAARHQSAWLTCNNDTEMSAPLAPRHRAHELRAGQPETLSYMRDQKRA